MVQRCYKPQTFQNKQNRTVISGYSVVEI